MTTITLKINEKSKKGKVFLEMAKIFYEEEKEVKLINENDNYYNEAFVEKIKKASLEKGRVMNSAEELWKNIK